MECLGKFLDELDTQQLGWLLGAEIKAVSDFLVFSVVSPRGDGGNFLVLDVLRPISCQV